MTKRLYFCILLACAAISLHGCGKEEINVNKPTVRVPSVFELYEVETGEVEVYTKNGKVTGPKANHLGGSKFLLSTVVTDITTVEFREKDTVYVHHIFKPDPSIEEKYSKKYTVEYGKNRLTLQPLTLSPSTVLKPSVTDGYALEKDFKKLEKLAKVFISQQNDSILKIDRYQEFFLRKKAYPHSSIFFTNYTDDDKHLYKEFIDLDTLWIRKQTFYLKQVKE